MNCECAQDGFCERYQREMNGRLRQICIGGVLPADIEAKYREKWLGETAWRRSVLRGSPIKRPTQRKVVKCEFLWKRVRENGAIQKRQLTTKCCGPTEMDLFHCRCPSQPMGPQVTLLDCARCPVLNAEKKDVFIHFWHGLGDAVAFTAVLAHLAKHKPGWSIDMCCQEYQWPLFTGKIRQFVAAKSDMRDVFDIAWPEGDGTPDKIAPTKAAKCLREVFGIEPEPELLRYSFEPSEAAKKEVANLLDGFKDKKGFVAIHYEGDQCRDSKDIPTEIADRLQNFLADNGYQVFFLDDEKRQQSGSAVHVGPSVDFNAALMARMTLNVMIDSGPGKLALTTKAPLLTVWRKANPMHNVDDPRGVHLVPRNWEDYIEHSHGVDRKLDRAKAAEFFRKTYSYFEYSDLATGLIETAGHMLGIGAAPLPPKSPAVIHSGPRKLTLATGICPGDVMTLTAAVEMLHQQHTGKYKTAVDVPCMAIWENNPWIVPADVDFERVQVEYHTIHESGNRPISFLSGYTEFLAQNLNIPLKLTTNRPHLYLSNDEKNWMNQVWEVTGSPAPYWVIVNGIKHDYGAKAYPFMQEVVDLLAGKVRFAQIGKTSDIHRPLRGVVNLLDKTSDRALIRLVYHAQGVVSTVTFLMHLAAAFEKPAVIVAGGREPRNWNQYSTNTVLSTVGALDCCRTGACWRSRVVAQNDGKDGNLCSRPMPTEFPAGECMTRISPELVAKAVEMYL